MEQTMNEIIKDNDVKPISDDIKAGTELVLADGTSLEQFETKYNSISKDMSELCVIASKLASFNRTIFKEYAVDTMGISNSAVTMMIKAGDLYLAHEPLKALPYTKTYELQPVAEQVDEFVETVGGYEVLTTYSQADLREKVKNYIKGANAIIEESDEEQTGEESENNEPDETDESGTALDTTPTELEVALKATIEMLSGFNEGDEIDADDIKLMRMCQKALSKHIRKEVIFNEE